MICPCCHAPHRGPRDTLKLLSEGGHVLIRAHGMPVGTAAEYLRIQWLAGARELEGWCANCIWPACAKPLPHPLSEEQIEEGRVIPMRRP